MALIDDIRNRTWIMGQAHKLRKQLVEPVFGIIKEQQMARRFLLRGLVNPESTEWTARGQGKGVRELQAR